MDLQSRKLELIQEFLKIQSEDVISLLEKILKKETKNSNPMTIEEFNSRIDQSMKDSRDGKVTDADAFKAIIEKWD